jgi:hypothetical protein
MPKYTIDYDRRNNEWVVWTYSTTACENVPVGKFVSEREAERWVARQYCLLVGMTPEDLA